MFRLKDPLCADGALVAFSVYYSERLVFIEIFEFNLGGFFPLPPVGLFLCLLEAFRLAYVGCLWIFVPN